MEFQRANMKCIIAILLYVLSSCALGVEAETSFHRISDCICSGDTVTYQCTVCGGLATVWEGTAFDCDGSGDEVTLTHLNFGTSASFRECNNGRIIGRGLSVVNGCFTSQLNVTFEPGLRNRTVICSVDDGTQSNEVGRDVLHMSTEPFRAPTVSVQEVNQTGILFSWNQTHRCPSLYNDIFSRNCGICPNITTGASASCVNFTTSADQKVCEFELQVVTCGNSNVKIRGSSSTPVLVNLTVPRVSQVLSVPRYLLDGRLQGLTITFAKVAPFVIYKGINGSIKSYTVTYSDIDSSALCYLQKIPAINGPCSDGICIIEFNVSSSMCPQSTDNVSVSIIVTTNLGDGPKSNPITEEYQNIFVTVEIVAQTTSINCTFPGMITRGADYSCNATIIYGTNCQYRTNLTGEIISSSLISIGLRRFLEQSGTTRSCGFVANVTAGKKNLTVKGNIDFVTLFNGGNNGTAIATATVTLLIIIFMVITVTIPTYLFWRYKRVRKLIVQGVEISLTRSINGPAAPLSIPKMYRVDETCNMIEFAKKIHSNYKPDSGTGYFQLQCGSSEYISATTEVVLVNKDKTGMRVGPEARQLLGFCDRRQPVKITSSFQWKYVFIQSTSRIRKLPKGSHFIFYPEPVCSETSEGDLGLKIVRSMYYRLYVIYEETTFGKIHKIHKVNLKGIQNPELMQYFHEFTEPELLPYSKQVILMDKNNKLYYGPGVRCVLHLNREDYNDAEERQPPNFHQDSRWKKVFLQSASIDTILKPSTRALFCTVGSTILVEVIEPFVIFEVTEEDESSRNLFKFARERVPDYNEIAGYSYYEFTKRDSVVPWRNVMALKKNGKLYTGPAVYDMIGAPDYYDNIKEIDPPNFSESDEWECVFIQGTSYEKILERNTRFLYCEYNYNPK